MKIWWVRTQLGDSFMGERSRFSVNSGSPFTPTSSETQKFSGGLEMVLM